VLFWVTTWYSDVVEYQRFRGSCCLHLHPEDASTMILRWVGVLTHPYKVPTPMTKIFRSSLYTSVTFYQHISAFSAL